MIKPIFMIGLPVYLIAMGWFLYGPDLRTLLARVRAFFKR